MLSGENLSVMRSPYSARKNKSKPSQGKQEMQSLTQATEQVKKHLISEETGF